MSPASVYLNKIATAVPPFDIHDKFSEYGPGLLPDEKSKKLFRRMAARAQIEHRYSYFKPDIDRERLDVEGFYARANFPNTHERMKFYEAHAFLLARQALDQLDLDGTTHIIVTTCTGFYAPGLDLQIIKHYGLNPSIERTMVGFMGCYAAFNALKLARHIVRSGPANKVVILNLELCTLHLKESGTLEEILPFLIFADGCAASIVSGKPEGLELEMFETAIIPTSEDQITWQIGVSNFEMNLSGKVPSTVAAALPSVLDEKKDIVHWAIHPGGRSILDAVQEAAGLTPRDLAPSRDVLRRFGNMSSATIMFVLADIMGQPRPGAGRAMAFGPGLTIESMRFRV